MFPNIIIYSEDESKQIKRHMLTFWCPLLQKAGKFDQNYTVYSIEMRVIWMSYSLPKCNMPCQWLESSPLLRIVILLRITALEINGRLVLGTAFPAIWIMEENQKIPPSPHLSNCSSSISVNSPEA